MFVQKTQTTERQKAWAVYVRQTNGLTDGLTDICNSRVAFATEKGHLCEDASKAIGEVVDGSGMINWQKFVILELLLQ